MTAGVYRCPLLLSAAELGQRCWNLNGIYICVVIWVYDFRGLGVPTFVSLFDFVKREWLIALIPS